MDPERRSAPRIRAYRPVRLIHPGSPQVVETLTKDLAVGGLQCLSPAVFPVSTEFTIELVLSAGDEPLAARGRTVWFRSIPHSEQFDLGIVFSELSQQNKRRLSGYLEHLAEHSSLVPS